MPAGVEPRKYLEVHLDPELEGVITYIIDQIPPTVTVPTTVPVSNLDYKTIYDTIEEMIRNKTPRGYVVPDGFCNSHPDLCRNIKLGIQFTAAGVVAVGAVALIIYSLPLILGYEAVVAGSVLLGVIYKE